MRCPARARGVVGFLHTGGVCPEPGQWRPWFVTIPTTGPHNAVVTVPAEPHGMASVWQQLTRDGMSRAAIARAYKVHPQVVDDALAAPPLPPEPRRLSDGYRLRDRAWLPGAGSCPMCYGDSRNAPKLPHERSCPVRLKLRARRRRLVLAEIPPCRLQPGHVTDPLHPCDQRVLLCCGEPVR